MKPQMAWSTGVFVKQSCNGSETEDLSCFCLYHLGKGFFFLLIASRSSWSDYVIYEYPHVSSVSFSFLPLSVPLCHLLALATGCVICGMWSRMLWIRSSGLECGEKRQGVHGCLCITGNSWVFVFSRHCTSMFMKVARVCNDQLSHHSVMVNSEMKLYQIQCFYSCKNHIISKTS